jgi:tRNA modification GTPase
MNTGDTICAVCTGTGGAISVIRIAGPDAVKIINKVWHGKVALRCENARKMLLGNFGSTDGEPALAVYMPGPQSYTGDDVAELHCHGGTLVCRRALSAIIAAGARAAEPGEFTFRAFINGKVDLTQAEAVSDLISAHSEMALHLAERQLNGSLRKRITALRTELIEILAECESTMDFTEENLDWTAPEIFAGKLREILSELQRLRESASDGAILRDGVRVVIAGMPNVGKSSLLNYLLGYDRAIVTQLPGTTRDTLEETVNLRNIPVRLTDTAGIRESSDMIEGLGIDRSRQIIRQSQIILWMLDASSTTIAQDIEFMSQHLIRNTGTIAIWNKIDLAPDAILPEVPYPSVAVSTVTGTGIDTLLDTFERMVWGSSHHFEPEIAVNSRHSACLDEAINAIPAAAGKIASGDIELAAVNLREVITALGNISGDTASPDILEHIFSRFCIGK